MPAPYETHRAQLKAILLAWGMPEDNAETTADILSWADLHGVDSHGMSMIPGYDRLRRDRAGEDGRAAGDREADAGLRAGRRRRRARPRAGAFRHADRDRQGEAVRHGDRRGAQLGAFRRHRLLHADGGEGGADRHGLHLGLQHPGGADLRQAGAARHRPLVVRRAHRRRAAVPARHGDHHGRRRPHPQQGERGAADAGRLGAGQRGTARATTRWWRARRAAS